MRELHLVFDGYTAFVKHHLELVDQDLSVDPESWIAVDLFVAEIVNVCSLLAVVFEGERAEVEAFGSDAVPDTEGVEDAEGVGGEHDGAALDERVGLHFVDVRWDA